MVDFLQLETWRWADYEELESTNDEALRLSMDVSSAGRTVITAQRQTKGRGRRGRSWIGCPGNLFMSLLLPWSTAESGALVFVVSLALLQAVKRFSPQADICLKWPNDVLVGGRKISGILLEAASSGMMVAGVGVNIASAPEDENMLYSVTSLREVGINCDRTEFLQVFLREFNETCAVYRSEGMAKTAELWRKEAGGIGALITVRMPKTEERGIFEGIDDNGLLLLKMPAGDVKTISAGDVFFDEDKKKEEVK